MPTERMYSIIRLDRKRVNRISYIAILVSALILFILQLSYGGSHYPGYAEVKDLEIEKVSEGEYSLYATLPDSFEKQDVIVFKSENIFWDLYVDDKLIESFTTKEVSPGMTAGDHWHIVMMPADTEGGHLRIDMHMTYRFTPKVISEIFYANHKIAAESLLKSFIMALMLSVFTIAVSLMIILANVLLMDPERKDYTLSWMGAFGICMSFWSIAQSPVVSILYGFSYVIVFLLYTSMAFTIGFASFYFMSIAQFPKTWWNRMICLFPFVVAVINPILDIAHIVPFGESSLVLAINFIQFSTMVVAASLRLIHQRFLGVNSSRLIGIASLYMVAISWLDVFQSNFMHGNDYTGNTRVALIIYMIIVGGDRLLVFSDYRHKMEEARLISRMAYIDGLTGIANRMAFNKRVRELEETEKNGFVSFDVNNLKTANDVYGHIEGDNLICLAAHGIEEAFKDVGTVYRYGGDEFVVIMEEFSKESAEKALSNLDAIIDETNREGVLRVEFSIAKGYAGYDEDKDNTLMMTLNRADEEMYENKKQMKKAKGIKDMRG